VLVRGNISALTRPGNLSFPSNLSYSHDLISAGGLVVRQPSGHLVLYGVHGRRILATDPDGNPLHECEWSVESNEAIRLVRARFRLDWGQWVGLKPAGLINSTVLDLSRKPGWQRLRADDLRHMAAQALRVPLDEVRFFYSDEDLVIDANGQATIRQKKDAFYILDDGTFDRARFMACMGAMHWHRIDFLPVVELFQSLLPGTGSAAFELIRGLYDDQNEGQPQPLPLAIVAFQRIHPRLRSGSSVRFLFRRLRMAVNRLRSSWIPHNRTRSPGCPHRILHIDIMTNFVVCA
jgi:hypothetical protein